MIDNAPILDNFRQSWRPFGAAPGAKKWHTDRKHAMRSGSSDANAATENLYVAEIREGSLDNMEGSALRHSDYFRKLLTASSTDLDATVAFLDDEVRRTRVCLDADLVEARAAAEAGESARQKRRRIEKEKETDAKDAVTDKQDELNDEFPATRGHWIQTADELRRAISYVRKHTIETPSDGGGTGSDGSGTRREKPTPLIAFDLEHHSDHSYRGFVCLIQMSILHPSDGLPRDFLIDPGCGLFEPAPASDEGAAEAEAEAEAGAAVATGVPALHLLNEVTADPRLLKIFHGGERDVQWLQRDFGV